MARVHFELRVDVVHRIVYGDAGFPRASRDEFQLPGIAGYVSGSIDARYVGGHHLIDLDVGLVRVEAPILDGTEIGVEAEKRDDRVDLDGLLFLRLVLPDRDAFEAVGT